MTMTPQLTNDGLLNGNRVPIWRAILSAVCYFVYYFALRLVLEFIYGIYLGLTLPLQGLSEEAANELINQAYFRDGNYLMIIADVLIFLILAIVFLARGKTFADGMGMKKTKISSVLLAFLAGLGLTCALTFVMIFVSILFPGVMEDYSDTMDASYNMETLIPYILAGVIGAPLIEELIFRHLITGRLSRGIPRIVAILIGSTLFGVIHGHWVQWIYAGVLGFVMACMYFAYDSIWVPIAMHAGFNSLSVLAYVEAMELTEAQETIFNISLFLGEAAVALIGVIVLIYLLIARPHKIFKKPAPAVPTEFTLPTEPVQSIYKPYEGKSVMTVAEFSAMQASSAPVSAEPAVLEEPAASSPPENSAEASADEAGGDL